MRDYYQTLQVIPEADDDVIAAAYRRLAHRFHPDRSQTPGADERMRELNEAFAVLGDRERRRAYDRSRRLASAHTAAIADRSAVRTPPAPPPPTPSLPPPRARSRLRTPLMLVSLWVACFAGAVMTAFAVWQTDFASGPSVPGLHPGDLPAATTSPPLRLPRRSLSGTPPADQPVIDPSGN